MGAVGKSWTSTASCYVTLGCSLLGTCLPLGPAPPSYNHPPLLVTEAATPHCTL